jgi:hypothetical protein
MLIGNDGIVSASRTELLAIWLYDSDLFNLFPFGEFLVRCIGQGVMLHG